MVNRNDYVNIRTRVNADVGNAIKAIASEKYPMYKVVRDIVTAYVNGSAIVLHRDTLSTLSRIVEATGYTDIDSLVCDLAEAFLRVYRYNNDQLREDESTPDEEIRTMFESMTQPRNIEHLKHYTIYKATK